MVVVVVLLLLLLLLLLAVVWRWVAVVPRRDVGCEILRDEPACEASGSPQDHIEALGGCGGHGVVAGGMTKDDSRQRSSDHPPKSFHHDMYTE